MAVINYKKYKVSLNHDTNKTQGLRTGDIIRRQYFDGQNTIYSLMCVLEYGKESNIVNNEVVSNQYFIGALLEGDAPQSSELLDFARITNLFDEDRSGAMYLTASDQESPYMDVIDGIAKNFSLCWPEGVAINDNIDPSSQYIIVGEEAVDIRYFKNHTNNTRACRFTVNQSNYNGAIGLSQDFYQYMANPQRLVISYKIKANREISNITGTVKYSTGDKVDGEFKTNCTEVWEYRLHVISIENSGRHLRTFSLDFNDSLCEGDEIIISDLNIIMLSSLSGFQDASHVRMGKLNGVHDKVFGDIDGYGAYLQKLYASHSVNISGTITAGDENGFSSTFYAGKIHRNAFLNSINIEFKDDTQPNFVVPNPTKMGNVYEIIDSAIFKAQNANWLESNVGKTFCFSFWALANENCSMTLLQNDSTIGSVILENETLGSWRRCKCTFTMNAPKNEGDEVLLTLLLASSSDISTLLFTSPQLELGGNVTQYQATDDTLNYTDEYGAWFNQGGIGGTIQNPLLQLNFDGEGSIGTRTRSFQLKLDGSGYLAHKNIQWDEEGLVLLSDKVKIGWGSFTDDAKDEMSAKSVKINGVDTLMFTATMEEGVYKCDVDCVELVGDDINIPENATRKWSYFNGSSYIDFKGELTNSLVIDIDDDCWNQESKLMVKYEVTYNQKTYYDTITIKKIYQSGYQIKVNSSQGENFHNGRCITTLAAEVYYQGIAVSPEVIEKSMAFQWVKYTFPDLENPVEDWWKEIRDEEGVLLQAEVNPESQSIDIYNVNTIQDKYVCILSVENVFPYPTPMIL